MKSTLNYKKMKSTLNYKKDLFLIVEKGKFYFPAYKHYSIFPINITCIFCNKSNLDCSIGFENKDLCLKCVDLLVILRPD